MSSGRKTELSATKQALLERFRQGKLGGPSESRIIPKREDATRAPLSFAQQRLWVLEQLNPGNTTYNITAAVLLKGTLDVTLFERALNEVIRRQAILRTSFKLEGNEPIQIIAPQLRLMLPVADLSHLGEREREAELRRLAGEQARNPFDLARGPLLRAFLLRLGETEHALLFSMHHIISDGWSTGILISEVSTLYEAFLSEARPSLPDLNIQYADFAAWQRESLQEEALSSHLSYWQQQLSGMPAILELHVDKPRASVRSYCGATKFFKLPRSLSEQLHALSRTENATLFMTLLASFKALLCRYSAKDDIVVGTPVAGRNRLQLEALIGFFVNMLVLRTDLSGDPSFIELLSRVRKVALGGQAHQDLPFEKLVDALQPERSLTHTPLIQVVFVLQNTPRRALRLDDLTINFIELESGAAKFDLTLEMTDTEEGLGGSLEYNTDIFCASTIERMARHFQTLLESIVANPHNRISELSLLSPAERRRLLNEQDDQAGSRKLQTCIHELFEAQAGRAPSATALVFEKTRLSYRDLNRRANQLAHHLKSLGVGPEVLVGICVERSINTIVGILGILKAGGAYLPLDPDYPPERLAFMIEDARPPVILTQQAFVERLPKQRGIIVCLDADWERVSAESNENQISGIVPDNTAYVIYTSGSTGKPKGVLVTHHNVACLFKATEQDFCFDKSDVWTLFHSYAFDFSVWEVWGALLYGGRLVIVPYLVSRDPEAFYGLLSSERVTVLNQTPSAFRQLVQAERSIAAPKELLLRLIVLGGEALEMESLRPWFDFHGDARPLLVNMYGITETTVHVTYRPLSKSDLSAAGSRIGGAINDLRLYIMDKHLNPTPVGVPGEIYVGGDGLARGYLNRPELTSERFIPNPYSNRPGERLYKTGDLARHLDDGDVEYLGRLDLQVKIRGFRIEIREIENTLAQLAGVEEAVVLAREETHGDKYLVAYIVFNREASLSVNEVRNYLRARQPEYLVPSAFVVMDALPLTSNNKIDYKALPVADRARPNLDGAFIAPRNQTEEALAEIWADVLKIEQVGIHDNFFDLGGDSIRSIQVCARAQKMGLGISTPQVFLHQTVSRLAREIDAAQMRLSLSERVETEAFGLVCKEDLLKLPDDVEDAYPLTRLQAGILFYTESDFNSSIYYNINTIHLRAPFNFQAMSAALQQLALAHPILRASFDMTGYSEPLQLIHKTVFVPLEIEDVRHLSPAKQEQVIAMWVEAEKHRRFNLARPSLLRFKAHRRSNDTFQFSWTEHHAILDGWSVACMLTELFQTYYALLTGDADLIAKPPASTYRDFVAAERQAIGSGECRAYWAEKLEGKTVTALPKWSLSDDAPTRRMRLQEVSIPADVSERLKALAERANTPIRSALLAAHLRVLSLLGGQADVITGLVTNGRLEEADGERALGLFLNTVPLRVMLRGGDWVGLVRSVFQAEQELLPFRRYPLAEIQKITGGRPLFETMFNFVHFHVYENLLKLSGLEVLEGESFLETNFTLEARFSLNLPARQVELSLSYDSGQLCEQQIEAIACYYVKTLTAMVDAPEQRFEYVCLLSEQESNQILMEWNDTYKDYPNDKCIHQLFEKQTSRAGGSEALVFGNERLTYGELNLRANKLAHHLIELGVGPEVLVGVCMKRGVGMVVALLAVLKAGGAYVPLDPDYPSDRLKFMLKDAQATVLLTQKELSSLLAEQKIKTVCVDSDWSSIDRNSAENPFTEVRPDNLAYLIYTSGSTGRPKGVAIEHRSAVAFLHWARDVFSAERLSGVLAATSVCFDLSIFELFAPLSWGGKVILAQDALQLPTLMAVDEVTLVNTVPSAMTELVGMDGFPSSARTINLAGERLQSKLVRRIYEKQTVEQIFNLYGPSEDTTYSSFALMQKEDGGDPTIGRPIANTQMYILDSYLEAVPVGVTGELYIGGEGLARCYFNRPEATAERFIPNPYGKDPGQRIYKTGDLARYLPDGKIDYQGRMDHQVKIRGFRIELGEIESVLSEHPSIRQAVVSVSECAEDNKRLTAYVVPTQAPAPAAQELRNYMRQKLPDHMVPSVFVVMEALPLTPNGKINRSALPEPGHTRYEMDRPIVPPRNGIEAQLTGIWESVLNIRPVGVTDNFFEIGGHSILALHLLSRIRKEFGRDWPLSTLLQNPTIEGLAYFLGQQDNAPGQTPLIGLQTSGSKPPFFCVHPIGGDVFCYIEMSRCLGLDQPLYALQAPGLYGEREPYTDLKELAAYYVGAVRALKPQGPYFLGGWSFGGVVAFEMARQIQERGDEVALLALIDSRIPVAESDSTDSGDGELKAAAGFLIDLAKIFRKDVVITDEFRHLSATEQEEYIFNYLRRLGIVPSVTGLKQVENLLQVFKSNRRALKTYEPQYYTGASLLIRAGEAAGGAPGDLSLGWSRFIEPPLEVCEVPGNHYTMMSSPHIEVVAERLKGFLSFAQKSL